MRVAVYGGSFDPPHIAHAMVAGWLVWTEVVDEVWLLPAFAHAFGKRSSPFEDRVAWCTALARMVSPRVRVEPVERELPAPSYTWDTLQVLAERHPAARLRLVVGADVLPQTPRWHAWERIEAEFRPLVVGRQGFPEVEGAPTFPGVSSTEVRRRLRAGEPVAHLLGAPVAQLVEASGCFAPG